MINHNFSVSKDKLFSVCTTALNELKCRIIDSNSHTGTILAEKSMNLLTYGHKIRIQIFDDSTITIESESKGIQLFDWGTNSELETDIFNRLSRLVE